MAFSSSVSARTTEQQRTVISQVYAWMTAGLLVTGAVASTVASIPELVMLIFSNMFMLFGLVIAEIALVWYLSASINRLSPAAATGLFLFYAALNGLTLAAIFLVYTSASIAQSFFITAGTFGLMSVYGYTTKRDLTTIGNILVMAMLGFFVASLVNFFLRSEALYWIITYAGIVIFVGLIAWDTQKIKRMSEGVSGDDQIRRTAIIGALMLYLDFINLFLLLLRVFGQRR